ncbi:putative Zinc-type alcohol dehydrogenase-like protein [Glarea lozoyensis 74030]|uniref:Putative Zinc-type alcohol dehydrogenase-like protein n=1 Tax=Glarea lozoyensis (strain ATCC 74030 / MF5533) TaxID=1104152 RepID=H0EGW6_GLAL7|nr:putative Zinc-type alcohol dehydrogenase-like protein [Glarea lozoyensis 74030]
MSTPTSSQTYQVVLNDQSGDQSSPTLLNNLVIKTVATPVPGPGEVLIRFHAAGLNYRDLSVLANSPVYPIETISGYTVETTLGAGSVDGSLTQYGVFKDQFIVKKPANLSFEEAAAISACASTAVHALDAIEIKKGMTVLTQGTGGVSSFVIQFASALGAHVIATSSSDEKLSQAKSLGASDIINYKTTPNWAEEVLRITDGKGVDLVIDVGGAGTIEQSIAATKLGGTVALVGFLTPSTQTDLIASIIFGGKTLKGIRGQSKKHLERAVESIEKHNLHPIINTYEWADANVAFEDLRKGVKAGKLIIKV